MARYLVHRRSSHVLSETPEQDEAASMFDVAAGLTQHSSQTSVPKAG
jgi:hypothetical protein